MKNGTPKRPKTVPLGARFVDPLWQYGTEDARGLAQGQWCGWKKKGALAFVAQLEGGVLHGPTVEFHPDGGIARRASYERGEIVGVEELFAPTAKSDEPFPAEKPVARVVVDHGPRPRGAADVGGRAAKKRFFLADGAECNAHGTPLSALHCDAAFLVREAEHFAKQSLNAYVKHRAKVAPSAEWRAKSVRQPGLARDLGALWGGKARGDLKLALSLLERAKLPRHLDALRVEPVATLSAQAAGATCESIVLRGQRSIGALPIVALLSGLVPFAINGEESANGQALALSLFDDGDAFVYSCCADRAELEAASDDFASFVLFTAAREADKAGMLSPRARAHASELLSGRVRATSLGDVRWAAAPFSFGETRTEERHRRAAWLIALLAGKPLDVVIGAFESEDARALDAALIARLAHARPRAPESDLAPPDLIYAMFRGWFASDARLASLLELADKSKSSLVTSSAALVRSLEQRRAIGRVKGLDAIRRSLATRLAPIAPRALAG